MAVLSIRILPDPILRQKSKRVKTINRSIQRLIASMRQTLHAAPGRVGLAAPQVGTLLRVIVIGLPEEEDIVLINPEIVRRSGQCLLTEGCLSIPGYFGEVKRAEVVTAKGLDPKGKKIRIKASELLAQVLQHEIDHLNGVLYIDHLEKRDNLHPIEDETTEL